MKWKKNLFIFFSIFVFFNFLFLKNAEATSTAPVGLGLGMGSGGTAVVLPYQTQSGNPVAAPGTAGTSAPAPTPQTNPSLSIDCSNNSWGKWGECLIASFSYYVILTVSSWIAGVSGLLFNTVMNFSVVNMAQNFDTNKVFIEKAWTIMRDVVNIMFLFVLLWAGIMTIISGFESGTSKKVATVVVVALLINFSMLFTKVVIDASNIVAVEFYKAIEINNTGPNGWQGIAGAFMEKLRISSIFEAADKTASSNFLQIIYISLGGSVILFVLAIILFIASIMFLVRYIILVILILASSAAIGSWILPSLKKSIFDKWWSALIGQSFFAPVFIFFLYLTLIITDSLIGSTEGLRWVDLFVGTSGNPNPSGAINLLLNLLVVLGFLIGSIIVSKQLSNMAGSGAGKLNAVIGGAAIGGAAFLGRHTVARVGAGMLNNDVTKNWAKSNNRIVKSAGMLISGAGAKIRTSSFDPRNAGFGVSKLLSEGGITAKDGMEANKGGFAAADKARKDRWLSFKESARGGKYTEEEIKEREERVMEKVNKKPKIKEARQELEVETNKLEEIKKDKKEIEDKIAHEKSFGAMADVDVLAQLETELSQKVAQEKAQSVKIDSKLKLISSIETKARNKVREKYKKAPTSNEKLAKQMKEILKQIDPDSAKEGDKDKK